MHFPLSFLKCAKFNKVQSEHFDFLFPWCYLLDCACCPSFHFSANVCHASRYLRNFIMDCDRVLDVDFPWWLMFIRHHNSLYVTFIFLAFPFFPMKRAILNAVKNISSSCSCFCSWWTLRFFFRSILQVPALKMSARRALELTPASSSAVSPQSSPASPSSPQARTAVCRLVHSHTSPYVSALCFSYSFLTTRCPLTASWRLDHSVQPWRQAIFRQRG